MSQFDFIIVGAGPVGLYTATLLQQTGFSVRVIEKLKEPRKLSRAIGIHPPALRMFEELGLLNILVERGVVITRGKAFIEGKEVGSIPLGSGEGTDFVLSLPQYITEEILESCLHEGTILRGFDFASFSETDDSITVEVSSEGVWHYISARFLLGCDGKNSKVREEAGILWTGKTYNLNFCMGDFPDNSSFGSEAGIFLNKKGLVESFPLPDGMRRWILNDRSDNLDLQQLCAQVEERTGNKLSPADSVMFSAFQVYRCRAERVVKNRVILIGDSAHVMSPIGGQGMNTGWLHARQLVEIMAQADVRETLSDLTRLRPRLESYDQRVKNQFGVYARRAEFNTLLGAPKRWIWPIRLLVKVLLSKPVSKIAGKRFTMQA